MKQLEEHKISTWRQIFREDNSVKAFVTIDPSERSETDKLVVVRGGGGKHGQFVGFLML